MMTMEDRDGFIWMDGEWLDWRDAKIHVLTHTLHYGMGAFEGVRAYETEDDLQYLDSMTIRIDYLIQQKLLECKFHLVLNL